MNCYLCVRTPVTYVPGLYTSSTREEVKAASLLASREEVRTECSSTREEVKPECSSTGKLIARSLWEKDKDSIGSKEQRLNSAERP